MFSTVARYAFHSSEQFSMYCRNTEPENIWENMNLLFEIWNHAYPCWWQLQNGAKPPLIVLHCSIHCPCPSPSYIIWKRKGLNSNTHWASGSSQGTSSRDQIHLQLQSHLSVSLQRETSFCEVKHLHRLRNTPFCTTEIFESANVRHLNLAVTRVWCLHFDGDIYFKSSLCSGLYTHSKMVGLFRLVLFRRVFVPTFLCIFSNFLLLSIPQLNACWSFIWLANSFELYLS